MGYSSTLVTLISGMPVMTPSKIIEDRSDNYTYFIHRGVPIPFTGVSDKKILPPFPIVVVPFSYYDGDLARYTKIVDVSQLAKAFLLFFALSLLPAFFLQEYFTKKRLVWFIGMAVVFIVYIALFWSTLF